MEKRRYIYALSDPDTCAVKYVGASVNPLQRLWVHCAPNGKASTTLKAWITDLIHDGKRPVLCILEHVEGTDWASRETWWIQHYANSGHDLLNQNLGGDGPPSLPVERWSRDYDACVDCGRTDRIHASGGRCNTCNNRQRHRETKQPERPYHDWALDYPACVECGTTERPHKGYGLCTNCFARHKRRLKAAA